MPDRYLDIHLMGAASHVKEQIPIGGSGFHHFVAEGEVRAL
jgi:hypothetical protein